MKSKYLLIAILLCLWVILISVKTSSADIIVLKNGRKITGEIIKETDVSLTVRTLVGVVAVNKQDVSNIIKEKPELFYIRRGDYLMERGEYEQAITEYENALRINPELIDLIDKIEEAKKLASEALSKRLSPAFAKGDELFQKGYYESAAQAYRDVLKTHPEPEYAQEVEKKINKLVEFLLQKGASLELQGDYNGALSTYARITAVAGDNSVLAEKGLAKLNELMDKLFGEGDALAEEGKLAQAQLAYYQVCSTYPGAAIEKAAKERLSRLQKEFRYISAIGEKLVYEINNDAVITQIPISLAAPSPGSIRRRIQSTYYSEVTVYIEDTTSEGIKFILERNLGKEELYLIYDSKKEKIPLPPTEKRTYLLSFYGDQLKDSAFKGFFRRQTDYLFSLEDAVVSIVVGASNLNFITFPQKPLKVGDTWAEPITKQVRFRATKNVDLVGNVKYELCGFKEVSGYDCAEIKRTVDLTADFETVPRTERGRLLLSFILPGQTGKGTINLKSTGIIYFAHDVGKMISEKHTGEMTLQYATPGGVVQGAIQAITPAQPTAPPIPPEMMGPEMVAPEMGPTPPPTPAQPRTREVPPQPVQLNFQFVFETNLIE